MKNNKIFLFLIFQFLLINSQAQYYYLYGDKAFGGTHMDRRGNIKSLNNYDLILNGESFSNVSGNKTEPLCNLSSGYPDIWVLKIDTAFNILWQKNIGGSESEFWPNSLLLNDSLNFLISCRSNSDSSCNKSENNRSFPSNVDDYWIINFDNNGLQNWDKTYGSISEEYANKAINLSTGEIILGGSTIGGANGDKTIMNYGSVDYWLLKLDSSGNKIWDNVYGGSGIEAMNSEDQDLISTGDGSFILAGTSGSPISGNISDSCRGLADFWIIKIDSLGNKIWDNRFGGSNHDYLTDINHTKNNGFILCGQTKSPQSGEVSQPLIGGWDIWVVKIDSLGNKEWDKRFGGVNDDKAYHIQQDFDGGYWIGGIVQGGISNDISEPAYGTTDYWILKLDSMGNKAWDKRFGGPGENLLLDFSILPDSSIILFGSADSGISSVKTDIGYGDIDFWLVHFYYGNNPPLNVHEINESELISVNPNPAVDFITFTTDNNFLVQKFLVYDLTGKLVFEKLVEYTSSVYIGMLSPALYFYEARSTKGECVYGKLLRE